MKTKIMLLVFIGWMANAQAAQLLLNDSSVIGGSGKFNDSTFNTGVYSALHVVDNQTGTISEPGAGNFWLGRQTTANEFFVIDLGLDYFLIDQIDLFNTHNQTANDRATTSFTILGSNSVTFQSVSNGYFLNAPTTLLSGSLGFPSSAGDPIEAATYTSSNGLSTGTSYRYLQFTSVNYTGQGGGLNEIRIFGTPEPSRALLALAGLAAIGLRRRRRIA
jgi:MYXO-CTERM domain-containing protein